MNKIVDIAAVIDSPSALTQEQGEKIYSIVSNSIRQKQSITLDFGNIESMISPFLNTSIGKLYGSYTEKTINTYLHFKNFPQAKFSTLKIVVDNAKKYYSNKEKYASTVKDVIG